MNADVDTMTSAHHVGATLEVYATLFPPQVDGFQHGEVWGRLLGGKFWFQLGRIIYRPESGWYAVCEPDGPNNADLGGVFRENGQTIYRPTVSSVLNLFTEED